NYFTLAICAACRFPFVEISDNARTVSSFRITPALSRGVGRRTPRESHLCQSCVRADLRIEARRSLRGPDDHELVRQGIRNLLSACRRWKGVGEAGDGEQAVKMTQTLRPQVLIMDITMPQLDGLEATQRIKASFPETRVLILTMHESDQMVRRILKAGALAYVLKSDLAGQLV